jgi:rSAM/selenodomain-associated transferase 2
MKISIIIPTLNEARCIGRLLDYLIEETTNQNAELIVCDGGSTDQTKEIVLSKNSVRFIQSIKRGRAHQLNEGAAHASGDLFYFVHADTIPPKHFVNLILDSIQKGIPSGCFRYTFDPPKNMLRINAWFTKFKGFYAGGGDQTLFIARSVFQELGGYNPSYVIMEDFDLVKRIRKKYRYIILKDPALVSSRKYELNSYWKVQWANSIAIIQFKMGVSPIKIKEGYKKRIKTA